MIQDPPVRGFTLLIAVILSSVLVSVGLALLDISYKQVLLASTATQSQYAFYNADSALECALYWDQKNNAFDYTSPLGASNIICGNLTVTGYSVTTPSAGVKNTTFVIPCAGSGSAGSVTVQKSSTGATSVFANGYNSCDGTDARRVERGLKADYQGTAAYSQSTYQSTYYSQSTYQSTYQSGYYSQAAYQSYYQGYYQSGYYSEAAYYSQGYYQGYYQGTYYAESGYYSQGYYQGYYQGGYYSQLSYYAQSYYEGTYGYNYYK